MDVLVAYSVSFTVAAAFMLGTLILSWAVATERFLAGGLLFILAECALIYGSSMGIAPHPLEYSLILIVSLILGSVITLTGIVQFVAHRLAD